MHKNLIFGIVAIAVVGFAWTKITQQAKTIDKQLLKIGKLTTINHKLSEKMNTRETVRHVKFPDGREERTSDVVTTRQTMVQSESKALEKTKLQAVRIRDPTSRQGIMVGRELGSDYTLGYDYQLFSPFSLGVTIRGQEDPRDWKYGLYLRMEF